MARAVGQEGPRLLLRLLIFHFQFHIRGPVAAFHISWRFKGGTSYQADACGGAVLVLPRDRALLRA